MTRSTAPAATPPASSPDARFRMPTVFGPSPGPRADVHGSPFDGSEATRTCASMSFLSEARALERLLPPGFELQGEPVVTVEWTELRNLQWLAGRGYSMLGVKYPVLYRGRRDLAHGPFLAVLWENRAEPIITGREELGFAKLYCEIPPVRVLNGVRHYSASWDGHVFMELRLRDLVPAAPPAGPDCAADNVGTLHYRYLPRVSRPGQHDVAEAVLSPARGGSSVVESHHAATGDVRFMPATWEQMPTMHHIVNTLASLPMHAIRSATLTKVRGIKDLSDQRVLD